ncbi:signal peptidase I [Candidatus Vallotiella sp. (ex Adelges kitamiensis)]|uniref:signal peptidase I n=1 Tax=Candidatus Vallotiella sp. (ex Adelges kitamiensis) TaxID=2864217 RepID=UPI001CE297A3|nr:signal peptidase I [Candidatus Vallotia sp. (ex Adelges kitamiensis)]
MNLTLIFFILVVLTSITWAADKLIFLPQRQRAANAVVYEFDQHQEQLDKNLLSEDVYRARAKLFQEKLRQPLWLQYSASFFPMLLLVFLLRSFIIEPFKIPSGSMSPTLLIGDFILVNKYNYGIRLPIINKKIISGRDPQRGDVIVFRFPQKESIAYIKRIIGLPGDIIAYQNKRLVINGKIVPETPFSDYLDNSLILPGQPDKYIKQYVETLGNRRHALLHDPSAPPFLIKTNDYPYRNNCYYNSYGMICKVPAGHYFVMGDNRDNSADSRYWGFVPDRNLIGRAFFIWLNFSSLKRIGFFE